MNKPSRSLTVTAVEDSGQITAFINEFPALVVQGTSKEDIAQKLDKLILAFIQKLEDSRNNLEIKPQSLV